MSTAIEVTRNGKPKRNYVRDHARRTLRAAGLTDAEARKFVVNYRGPYPLSAFSRKLPGDKTLVQHLYEGFVWDLSPEGFGYWSNIVDRLNRAPTAAPAA